MKLALLAFGGLALFLFWRARRLASGQKVFYSAVLLGGIYLFWPPETLEERAARLAAPPSAPHEKTGCSASERAIKAQLKSPASAKFSDCHSATRDGIQSVTISVDSQNGFGAMIRSRWLATVRNGDVESVAQIR